MTADPAAEAAPGRAQRHVDAVADRLADAAMLLRDAAGGTRLFLAFTATAAVGVADLLDEIAVGEREMGAQIPTDPEVALRLADEITGNMQ